MIFILYFFVADNGKPIPDILQSRSPSNPRSLGSSSSSSDAMRSPPPSYHTFMRQKSLRGGGGRGGSVTSSNSHPAVPPNNKSSYPAHHSSISNSNSQSLDSFPRDYPEECAPRAKSCQASTYSISQDTRSKHKRVNFATQQQQNCDDPSRVYKLNGGGSSDAFSSVMV